MQRKVTKHVELLMFCFQSRIEVVELFRGNSLSSDHNENCSFLATQYLSVRFVSISYYFAMREAITNILILFCLCCSSTKALVEVQEIHSK